jgi:hypothetical protein
VDLLSALGVASMGMRPKGSLVDFHTRRTLPEFGWHIDGVESGVRANPSRDLRTVAPTVTRWAY